MYRVKDIEDHLLHLVGWRQGYTPETTIDPQYTDSESGLYFQNAHPLMTLENLHAIMPDNYGENYKAYNAATYYARPDIVYTIDQNGVKTYWFCMSETSIIGQTPQAGSIYWTEFNLFTLFVEQMTRDGITTAISTFIRQKQLTKETKNILEHRTLFDGTGRLKATVNNTHKIVGFEITPVRSYGVSSIINQIGLQIFGAAGTVRVYLFHSGSPYPVSGMDCVIDGSGAFKWFTPEDFYMPYIDDGVAAGGSWYLVYNQDDLPFGAQAINFTKDWSKEPCISCTGYVDYNNWRELTKYVQVSPFMVNAPEGWAENPVMWDVADMCYTTTQNYGLNANLTIGCDLTYTIYDQRLNFAEVIQKQVAATALRTMAMNPSVRVNRNQSNVSKNDILYEIDGDRQGRAGGIGEELAQAYKALSLDMKNIDRICLSCNNNGVKYRTV